MLYRGSGDVGQYAIYNQASRRETYGSGWSYQDFFNKRKDYPVPRYKSTIGSSSLRSASALGSVNEASYLVIPFDNSKIIFCPTPDMAAGAMKKIIEYDDDMFIMVEYSNNFKIDYKSIGVNAERLGKQSGRTHIPDEYMGVEFFTNADCLLYRLGYSTGSKSGMVPKLMDNGFKINQDVLNQSMDHLKSLIK